MSWIESVVAKLIQLVNIVLHLDKYLVSVVQDFGPWTYFVLGLVIFCETGLVVLPLLPGDSLLFAAGAISATGSINFGVLLVTLSFCAVVGDAVNYSVGYFLGPKLLRQGSRFLKKEYLDKTQSFYEKYGSKTIVIARFVPIVRTFAPFLAGVGKMRYERFAMYNVAGGILWVGICVGGGYFFGNIPIVKQNFSLVILGIIIVSVLPAVVEWVRIRHEQRAH